MSCLPQSPWKSKLWAEAVNTASHIRNRLYTSACNFEGKTPYEVVLKKKPDLSYIRMFGCKAFVHIPKEKRAGKSKFEDRARIGILVGFTHGNAYKVYFPDLNKFQISKDVTFDESCSILPSDTNATVEDNDSVEFFILGGDSELQESIEADRADKPPNDNGQEHEDPTELTPEEQEAVTHYPVLRRSTRVRRAVDRFTPDCAFALVAQNLLGNREAMTQCSFEEAASSKDSDQWFEAMQEEINAMETKKVWRLCKRPHNYKPVKNQWVYDRKRDKQWRTTRYRARLVAKGFTQKHGIDYNEVFAPVAKYTTLRLLLALAAEQDYELLQLDVRTAFLNGDLDEDIYIEQPEGFVVNGKEEWVYKLLKAINGLKQASRAWYKFSDSLLKSIGCETCNYDAALYVLKREGRIVAFILVYVDDMLLVGKELRELQRIAKFIGDKVEIRVEDEVEKFLGMSIERDRTNKTLKINNIVLVENILERFEMQHSRPVSTPLPQSTSFEKAEGEKETNYLPYQELVGALMHLSNTVRPDISHAVNLLERFMSAYSREHWNGAMHLLRYLNGSRSGGVIYRRGPETTSIVGYSDADYAGDKTDRKSTSGYAFLCANGCISWRSKKQPVTAQSTEEA